MKYIIIYGVAYGVLSLGIYVVSNFYFFNVMELF